MSGHAEVVRIAAVHLPAFGLAIASIGAALMVPGAGYRRISQFLPHPIHTGICMVCFGVSIAAGSASGLWLVSPLVALGCVALVLKQGPRLGGAPQARLIPQAGELPPDGMDRLSCYLFLLVPWLILYEAVLAIGIPPDAISGVTRFEQRLPVLQWTQIFYASTYLLALSVPLFAKTRSDLRRFSVRGLWTMAVAYPCFLTIPLIAPKRPFIPHGLPGRMLLWERSLDSPVAAFPSFHVIWSILAAQAYAGRWPKLKWLFYGWAALVAASCVTTSQHSVLDVLGGAATVALVAYGPRLLRRTSADYSIFFDCLAAITVTRLWILDTPVQMIAGLCLILTGLGRFVKATGRVAERVGIAMVISGVLITAPGLPTSLPAIVAALAVAVLMRRSLFRRDAVTIEHAVERPDINLAVGD